MDSERFYVYVLYSLKDHNLYIGYTTNLKRRLQEHAKGEVTATSHRRPLKLIKYEYFINIKDAKTREVFLKSGFGRQELKKGLQNTLNPVPAKPSATDIHDLQMEFVTVIMPLTVTPFAHKTLRV